MFTSIGSGRIHAAESDGIVLPRLFKGDGTKPGIVICHQGGATGSGIISGLAATPGMQAILTVLANAGYPMVSQDMGPNLSHWGNSTAVTRLTECRTYLQGTLGAKSGKVACLTVSMGGPQALNCAKANPTLISCAVSFLPATNLGYIRDNDIQSQRNVINTAYGLAADSTGDFPTHGSSLVALPSGANPHVDTPTNFPWLAYGTTDDPYVDNAMMPAMAAAIVSAGGTAETHFTGTGGHSDAAAAGADPQHVAAFFQAHA